MSLKLRYTDFETINRSCTLKRPASTNEAIFEEGGTLLDKALKQRRQLVRLIGIGVSNLTARQKQLDIFDKTPLKLEHLNTVIDRIRNKYGFTALQNGTTMPLGKTTYIRDRIGAPKLSLVEELQNDVASAVNTLKIKINSFPGIAKPESKAEPKKE